MSKTRIGRIVFVIALLGSALTSLHGAHAADARFVTAKAECQIGSSSTPTVRVTVTNHSGLKLHVAYNRSYSGPRAISAKGLEGLSLADPGDVPVITLDDGATKILIAAWAGRAPKPDESVSALVVTNAGVLLPTCGFSEARVDYSTPQPTVAGEEGQESAKIMAGNLGKLESFKAYPALYALLDPDVRKLVPYGAVACWYKEQYGPPLTKTSQLVYTTDVTDVTFVNWTWPVTGVEYKAVAEITYTQDVGVFPKGATTDPQTEHLVRGDDGLWRWFFGTDATDLKAMPTKCGLPAAI